MTSITFKQKTSLVLLAAGLAMCAVLGAGIARADSTPIGPLPAGPVASTTTKPGQLLAVALPNTTSTSALVWRVARAFDSNVVREVTEGQVGTSVVIVYKIVGRGDTSLVFALTRGDTSSKAVKSATYKIHSA
jgi:hypothetical protein